MKVCYIDCDELQIGDTHRYQYNDLRIGETISIDGEREYEISKIEIDAHYIMVTLK